jgi:hypothetical protein
MNRWNIPDWPEQEIILREKICVYWTSLNLGTLRQRRSDNQSKKTSVSAVVRAMPARGSSCSQSGLHRCTASAAIFQGKPVAGVVKQALANCAKAKRRF